MAYLENDEDLQIYLAYDINTLTQAIGVDLIVLSISMDSNAPTIRNCLL